MDRFLHAYVALTSLFTARRADEEGATAVEYGLIVALIAVVIIGAVTALGGSLRNIFQSIATTIGSAN